MAATTTVTRTGRHRSVRLRSSDRHGADNLTSAAIILHDVEHFGGDDAGLVRWARRIIARAAAAGKAAA